MEKLAVAVKARSVRLIDFFRAQDRLHSGAIARTMFHRVLAAALDITSVLTTAEMKVFETKFSFDTDKFFYERFLAELDKAVAACAGTDASFTRATDATLKAATAQQNPAAQAELAKLEAELSAKIHAERIDLLSCFRAFDMRRTGRVLKARFVRCFPFRVPERLVELVVQRYAVGAGGAEVDYSSWLAHLDLPAGMGGASFKQHDVVVQDANASPSVARTLAGGGTDAAKAAKIAAASGAITSGAGLTVSAARGPNVPAKRTSAQLVGDIADAMKRIGTRILEFLQDRDPARHGTVPVPAFESALGRVRVPHLVLDSAAFDTLVSEYSVRVAVSNDVRVDYVRFARDVDAAQFADAEKSPRRNEFSDAEMSRVNVVIERIRDAVRARRINMFPSFRDFDKVNGGTSGNRTCTAHRFARALTVNGIQTSPEDTALLVKYFSVKTPGEFESDAVDYENFCALVHDQDRLEASLENDRNVRSAAARASAAEATRAAFTKPLLGDHSVDEVLDSVAAQVTKRQVRLYSFFSDFDHHKEGSIPASKFVSVLATCKVQLQPQDIAALVKHYAHATLPQTVCYVRLLDDLTGRPVLAAGATSRAALGPYAFPTKTNAEALSSIAAERASADATAAVTAIVARVKECVRTRGILLPPFFRDYDKQHMGLITRVQFQQTLARHPLPLAPADSERLATHFADTALPTHVRWKEFVAAVDDIENPDLVRSAAARERAELQKRLERSQEAEASNAAAIALAENDDTEWKPKSIFVTADDATSSSSQKNNNSPAAASGGARPSSPGSDKSGAALDALFQLILTRRIRVNEFLSAATVDPLRHGTCAAERFLGALNMCGLRLPADQGAALVMRYATAKGEVDYNRFLYEINEAEATTQADRSHTAAAATRLGCGRDKLLRHCEQDALLKSTVEHIKRVAAARRLSTRPVFEAHDKLRIGTITEAQFLNSLSGPLTIHLEPRQSRALLDALAVPKDPRSLAAANPMLGAVVAYEGFCSVVDQ